MVEKRSCNVGIILSISTTLKSVYFKNYNLLKKNMERIIENKKYLMIGTTPKYETS